MLRRTWWRLRASLRKANEDEDFRAELQAHLDLMVEERVAQGFPEEQARREAKMQLGGIAQLEESHREWRGMAWLEHLAAYIRYALRSFRRNPRFAVSAVLIITVAIGAATAVFSLVDRTLLRPLPYTSSDRLVSIGIRAPVIFAQDWLFSATFQEWQADLPLAIEAISAWRNVSDCDRNDGTPERVGCALVDHRFLPTLGVAPVLGRNFAPLEDEWDSDAVALMSFAVWNSRFDRSASVIGRYISIDGIQTRIIGVLPRSFEMPSLARADFLLPLKLRKGTERQRVVQAIGRVRPGVPASVAYAHLIPLFQRFLKSAPADFRNAVPMDLHVVELRDHQTRGSRSGLALLAGAVLCFLLMACANVASLLLARSESRRHEFAVRSSIGATPGRLARQALTESLVLSVAGAAGGSALGWVLLRVFRVLVPEGTLRLDDATIDGRVLIFALALSLIVALVFGLAPALERLRGEHLMAPHVAGLRSRRLRSGLVALQFAVSTVLLTGTGALTKSLWRLQHFHPGFVAENVVTASFILPQKRYDSEEGQIAFFRQLEERLKEIPGVTAAALTDSLPPGGDPRSVPYVALVGGGNADAEGLRGLVKWRYVTPGYFKALGIPVRLGRGFLDEDRGATIPPVVISEALSKRMFGNSDPLTRQLRPGERIIGIAADVRNAGLQASPDPELYVLRADVPNGASRNQRPPYGWRLGIAVVRSTASTRFTTELIRDAVHRIEPSVAIVTSTLTAGMSPFLARPRFHTALLSAFAAIGLALAASGLYGLTSFIAAARTREVGVRLAVGATRGDIIALLMRRCMMWPVAGICAGLLVSPGLMQSMRALLFQVTSLDFGVVSASLAILLAATLAGASVPARRASRVAVSELLRHE